jgi:hypothetical protein
MLGDTSSADVHEVLAGKVVAIWPQFAEEIDGEEIWTIPVERPSRTGSYPCSSRRARLRRSTGYAMHT